MVGSSGLIPYVVFVAAPRVERLQMTRKMTSEKKKKLQSSFSADYLDRDLKSFTVSLLRLFFYCGNFHLCTDNRKEN